MPRRLPIFPLGTVLMPYGLLPLHIFEPRYRALMTDLFDHRSAAWHSGDAAHASGTVHGNDTERPDGAPGQHPEMGVVLIERGREVGGGDERSGLGTIAGIVRAEKFPDGRWFALAVGTERFSVAAWVPDDPYPLAEVDQLPPEAWDERLRELLTSAEHEVRRALALAGELGEPAVQPELSDDPSVASWQLCNAAPVGPFDRQKLLAADGIGARLELLAGMAGEASSILAFRLGG